VAQAARRLELGTRYSRSCCELITEAGGISALARLLMCCNTSRPHVDVATELLAILHNVARHDGLLPRLFAAGRDLEVIIVKLQFFRDTEVGPRGRGAEGPRGRDALGPGRAAGLCGWEPSAERGCACLRHACLPGLALLRRFTPPPPRLPPSPLAPSQDVFMSLAQLLLRLVSSEAHACHVAELRVDASSGGKQSAVQRLQVRPADEGGEGACPRSLGSSWRSGGPLPQQPLAGRPGARPAPRRRACRPWTACCCATSRCSANT
jgi:hypothetical protein